MKRILKRERRGREKRREGEKRRRYLLMNWGFSSVVECALNAQGPGLDPQPTERANPSLVMTTEPGFENGGMFPMRNCMLGTWWS